MRVLVASCSLLLVATISACGTGGISPQPPHLGKPWFEVRFVTPDPYTYVPLYQLAFCAFVLEDQTNDGHLDVVLVNGHSQGNLVPTAFVFRGSGGFSFYEGSFGLYGDKWTERRGAAAGDFDGDGWSDLVVTDADAPGVLTAGYWGGVWGLPAWSPFPHVATLLPPGKVVAGDWDEDGHLDAAYLVPSLDFVFLLPGNGDGTFGDPITGLPLPLATGADPQDLLSVDLDGDGHLDLATANRADDSVTVFLGDGHGHFHAQPPVLAPGGPRALTAADLDGDGDLDLAVACFDFSFGVGGFPQDQIDVLLSTGRSWALTLDSFVPLEPFEQPVDIVAADFDGDGDVDLAYSARDPQAVGTLKNDGQAGFTRTNPERIVLPGEPSQLEVADLNGDGKPDLAVLLPDWKKVSILGNVAP